MNEEINIDEPKDLSRTTAQLKQSLFIRFILATGLVKTEKNASHVLLGIALIGIVITVFSVTSSLGKKVPPGTLFKEGQSAFIPSDTA